MEGYKDILNITVGANETSKFWLGMLNDLKNRGLKDVFFFCVDGLPGFKEAIEAVYPQAQIQRCVMFGDSVGGICLGLVVGLFCGIFSTMNTRLLIIVARNTKIIADNQCKIGQVDSAREEQHKCQYNLEEEKDGAF